MIGSLSPRKLPISIVKQMTIISLKHHRIQFFNADFLTKTAKRTVFIQREWIIQSKLLWLSLIAALINGNYYVIAACIGSSTVLCV